MKLSYESTSDLHVNEINIVWENVKTPSKPMKKNNGIWSVDFFIPEGQYFYRFLINNKILINDKMANMYLPDKGDMLWSVLIVDSNGERLYNNEQYSVNIDEYTITNNIYEIDSMPTNKKVFNLSVDVMVATRFAFTNVTGIHTVNLIWVNPLGDIFDMSENNLFITDERLNLPIIIWFYLDLQNKTVNFIEGLWSAKLLVDGEYILEDKFRIIQAHQLSNIGSFNTNA